jgi:hypothetical protein
LLFFFNGSEAPVGPGLFFSFMIIFTDGRYSSLADYKPRSLVIQTVGLFRRVVSPWLGLYLNTGQHKHRINTFTHQTSVPCVGFEPTIPASERAKAVHRGLHTFPICK